MGTMEQERCMRLCEDLCRLLEDEKNAVSAFLAGDIYEEYSKLLDLEIEEVARMKRIISYG